MPARKKTASIDYEKTLRELEELVERLEQGDLSLEESLKQFERGIALTRACQAALKEAEQRVSVLLEKNGQVREQPLDLDDSAVDDDGKNA